MEDRVQTTRRRRPAVSCTICRRRKLKCDKLHPCGQCIKSRTPDHCVFTSKPPQSAAGSMPASSPSEHRNAPSDGHSPAMNGIHVFDSKHRVTKPTVQSSELHELRDRVHILEQALARDRSTQPLERSENHPASGVNVPPADFISDQIQDLFGRACFRGKHGRTRFRGRSSPELTYTFVSVLILW